MSKLGGSRMDGPQLRPRKPQVKVYVGWVNLGDAVLIVASATKPNK